MKRITLLFAFLLSSAASAADATMLLHHRVLEEVESADANGRKTRALVDPVTVVPGTELVYVTAYRNAGEQPAEHVVITNPVPAALEYRPGGTTGSADVSVDGGKSFGALNALRVKNADGTTRPARAADVTHVRWQLGQAVKPGQQGEVSFRARLK